MINSAISARMHQKSHLSVGTSPVCLLLKGLPLTESGLPLISLLLTVKVSVFSTYTVSTLTSPGHGVRPSDPLSFPLPRSLHSCQHQRTDGVIHHRLVIDATVC